MPITPEGIQLLREVQRRFEENPASCNMDQFLVKLNNLMSYPQIDKEWLAGRYYSDYPCVIESCNTVGCIAGMICVIKEKAEEKVLAPEYIHLQNEAIPVRAATYLGMFSTYADSYGLALFYQAKWPMYLQSKLSKEKEGTPTYAAVVNEAIEWFISEYSEKENV